MVASGMGMGQSSDAFQRSGLSSAELEQLLDVARRAAEAGGAQLRQHFGKLEKVREKGRSGDLVTEADHAAEAAVLAVLAAETPAIGVLAEESGRRPRPGELEWCVDPLDGTTNYAHRYPFFGTSIGLTWRGQPLLGALAVAAARQPAPPFYFDTRLLTGYFGKDRVYHHTAPVNMNFGMREALRLLAEEGLEAAWARHRSNSELLWAGLEALGLELHAPAALRLPTLTTVRIPEGVDGNAFSLHLLNKHGIEVGGGLGVLAGKVWRIGLMGYNSREENVALLLNLLEQELPAFRSAAPVAAAAAA